MEEQAKQELHFLDYWRVIQSRKEIILAVTLLVAITGTAYTLTMPKIFMANARIEVHQDALDIDVFERQLAQGYNPFFLRTQFEIIQSRPILYQVLDKLDLPRKWGEDMNDDGQPLTRNDAYRIIRKNIKAQQFRDTSLIEIQVYRKDPIEAALIANTVAEVYRDQRLANKSEEIRGGIRALVGELEKQKTAVNLAEEDLEKIRQDLQLSLVGQGYTPDKIALQQLEGDRIAARVDMLVRKARLEQIENLPDDELLHALTFIARDPILSSVKSALIDSQVSLRLMQEQYGPEHPDVKRIQAGVDELNKRIKESLDGLRKGLQADYEVALRKYEELDRVMEEAKEKDILAEGEIMLPFAKAARELDIQREILNALRARIAQEGIELEIPRTPVDIVDPAEPPKRPVSPNVLLNILLSIIVGLGSGVGLAYFIEYLDTSVRTVDDVERYLGLPVIGVIPQRVKSLNTEGPDSPHAEFYRVLRTNMLFANKGASGGAYAFTSGGVGEGKSTTLFNLAYVCAQLGEKVLIVDSDLRRPVQHGFLNVSNRIGLTDLLLKDVPLEEVIKSTDIPSLHFMPSGRLPRSALGLIDSQRMRDVVRNLKERYDYVFFDSPPLMGVSDASVLASVVDGVLLVIQYRKYPRVMSSRAKRTLENVGANMIGVVLNNINIMRDDYYYYYHSHFTHYRSDESDEPEEGEPEEGAPREEKAEEEVF